MSTTGPVFGCTEGCHVYLEGRDHCQCGLRTRAQPWRRLPTVEDQLAAALVRIADLERRLTVVEAQE